MSFFQRSFESKCDTASDINEHLPTLKKYADKCYSVLELGHRGGGSASAFLVSNAQIFHSVDLVHCDSWVTLTQEIAKEAPPGITEFKYWKAHSIGWTPERRHYDLIFFDTLHTGHHLLEELQKYSTLAAGWMILHDTEAFGEVGERAYAHGRDKGLKWALSVFLLNHPDGKNWRVLEHFTNNNGLTVLERV